MEEKMILKLTDGGIVNIETDNDYIAGCPTCDYGSEYINDIVITTTKFKAMFKISQMYDYVYSDLLKTILGNIDEIKDMRELSFIMWFIDTTLKDKDERHRELRHFNFEYRLYDKDKKMIEEIIF
ncbi:MAG: hypothetical protein IKE75_00830 [Bacilli bacterium]|nr:hypothetical protein [Bacilli bacterium]